jgi:beta-phosphoglucomutase
MQWIHDYQLFLFDFDGLLVNTEELHYQAYSKMCANRGFQLPWDFLKYCRSAHYDQDTLRRELFESVPDLKRNEPDWEVLYQEKKQAMVDLLSQGAVRMMPGAGELLKALDAAGIAHCVVTNSPDEQIQLIRAQNPILNTISHWFTRETYSHPKPHPECYLNAIKALCPEGGRVIGFEDTPRGMRALLDTPATPVFISQVDYPELSEFKKRGAVHFSTLTDFLDSRS